jgi:hypothetical protein
MIRRVLGRLRLRRGPLVAVLTTAFLAVVAIAIALPGSRERVTGLLGDAEYTPSGEVTAEPASAEPDTSPPETTTEPGVVPPPEPTREPGPTPPPVSPDPGDTPGDGSGVYGTVQAGPTCPVEREDSPCPDRPVDHAVVRATTQDGHTAGRTNADGEGRFTMELAPGTYDISADTEQAMYCESQRVVVEERRFTRVTITCDTGIR